MWGSVGGGMGKPNTLSQTSFYTSPHPNTLSHISLNTSSHPNTPPPTFPHISPYLPIHLPQHFNTLSHTSPNILSHTFPNTFSHTSHLPSHLNILSHISPNTSPDTPRLPPHPNTLSPHFSIPPLTLPSFPPTFLYTSAHLNTLSHSLHTLPHRESNRLKYSSGSGSRLFKNLGSVSVRVQLHQNLKVWVQVQ